MALVVNLWMTSVSLNHVEILILCFYHNKDYELVYAFSLCVAADDPHYCEDQCHLGGCPVCDKQSTVTCKCGKTAEVHISIRAYICM